MWPFLLGESHSSVDLFLSTGLSKICWRGWSLAVVTLMEKALLPADIFDNLEIPKVCDKWRKLRGNHTGKIVGNCNIFIVPLVS